MPSILDSSNYSLDFPFHLWPSSFVSHIHLHLQLVSFTAICGHHLLSSFDHLKRETVVGRLRCRQRRESDRFDLCIFVFLLILPHPSPCLFILLFLLLSIISWFPLSPYFVFFFFPKFFFPFFFFFSSLSFYLLFPSTPIFHSSRNAMTKFEEENEKGEKGRGM